MAHLNAPPNPLFSFHLATPGSARVSVFRETTHLACCAAIMLMCLKFASILHWPWARPPFADLARATNSENPALLRPKLLRDARHNPAMGGQWRKSRIPILTLPCLEMRGTARSGSVLGRCMDWPRPGMNNREGSPLAFIL
ncbi:hypothetical protein ASPNIDRAFT_36446 [Aspergillus niger ATCC 1015]|uniref:Uncharacterized protein n=1 Tax=Aspergillus niger (strain ATCC 1015 / CBS 113.46 / FGSC A1144 / LSHB Ac4 / NCTC 3858a / NRRL 328 / USDA 3528.7) TaxID=380704 RepID=G3XQI2_ASPNA|nr:uncharacterized protein BO96DRAFT_485361 [Aspergillus niger CBS 101883]EHA26124.1 hypothetical protein ASPNIDRAFT_36446 [Aspergillus niger ATCC 1015]PYH52153.1 hypothetical protein BO96DRAFT_485361 [Aspergillus niger CBS 101883]